MSLQPLVKSLSVIYSLLLLPIRFSQNLCLLLFFFFNVTLNSSKKLPTRHLPENRNRDHQRCTQVSTATREQQFTCCSSSIPALKKLLRAAVQVGAWGLCIPPLKCELWPRSSWGLSGKAALLFSMPHYSLIGELLLLSVLLGEFRLLSGATNSKRCLLQGQQNRRNEKGHNTSQKQVTFMWWTYLKNN